jgi:hypothetical protein
VTDDATLIDQVAAELFAHPPGPMELVLRPDTALSLVGLLQLSLRHPGVAANSPAAANVLRFIDAVKIHFASCPAVLTMIDRGFQENCDVHD